MASGFTIDGDDDGVRIDRFLRRQVAGLPQGRIEKLLRLGKIKVDGRRAKSSHRLSAGEVISAPDDLEAREEDKRKTAAAPPPPHLVKEIRQSVIVKNDDWIAINKPSGLAVQGGSSIQTHLDGALEAAFPEGEKPRLVHRLDRETSGVMVLARSAASARKLTEGFRARRHGKRYFALLAGKPPHPEGVISAALSKRAGAAGEKMVIDDEDGQIAETRYRIIDNAAGRISAVMLEPLTGRKHQLRVHMASLGCPVLGDGKYGGADSFPSDHITRLCLHALALRLDQRPPIIADIPDDLAKITRFFGFEPPRIASMIADWESQ